MEAEYRNSNKITIVEFPTDLGLKKTVPGSEPGVKRLPDWLRKHHFHERLHTEDFLRLEPPNYAGDLDEQSGVRNANNIIAYAKKQSEC